MKRLPILLAGAWMIAAGSLTASEPARPLTDAERLFDRGARRVYRSEYLKAISLPVGGIAAGPIMLNGEGRRANWQIFKNYRPLTVPHSFFAVRAKAAETAPVVRALQTKPEGPFAAMKELCFSGEYPFGWYTFEDPALPIAVRMEVFSPLIPLDEKNSAIPCAIFNLTAENEGDRPVEVSFLAAQQNAVGLDGLRKVTGRASNAYGGNRNRVLRPDGTTLLHLGTTKPKNSPAYGDMALFAVGAGGKATASWESLETLWAEFSASGSVSGPQDAGPSPAGQTIDGALALPFVLQPGQKRTVTFVLTWHFPNVRQVPDHQGNMYANWWPDALAVAGHVTANLDNLTAQTRLYNSTLYSTNLPYWLLDRISSQVAILNSMTCSWTADGFFYGWEGCSAVRGCCCGNATHVWGYAQSHARLFPRIGRIMREQDARNLRADGMLPVRIIRYDFPAFDGQCSFVMSSYREHLMCADGRWLTQHWPKAKKAMNYLITRWDADEDGMLSGPQHGMDGDQGGTSSWMGSMYLGALAAAERMAEIQNDAAAASRYRKIRLVGARNQDKALFNGEYYIQIPDSTPREDYLTGCLVDQMLGQWWAQQINLGWLYPPDHVRSAMQSLLKHNFRTNFHGFRQAPRKFVDEEDAGMLYCTWPRGGRPKPPTVIQNADEVMAFEYSVAGLMVYCGLLRESFTVARAAADRYDGRLRSGLTATWNSALGHSGNPFGDDECGKFYARAMSVWSMLLACQGFSYDGPAGLIGMAPVWKPEDHVSFFTTAEGWGTLAQQRRGNTQTNTIELKWGRLRVRMLKFELPEGARLKDAAVTVAGQPVAAKAAQHGKRVTLRLASEMIVDAGNTAVVKLAYQYQE